MKLLNISLQLRDICMDILLERQDDVLLLPYDLEVLVLSRYLIVESLYRLEYLEAHHVSQGAGLGSENQDGSR